MPLSQERVQNVIEEMIESFGKQAIGRKIIKPVQLRREDKRREESGFISFGMDHIVDKIWFVDGVFEDVAYGYQGIGMGHGRGIAEAETSHVIERILGECKENKVEFSGKIRPSDILRSLEFLQQREIEAKAILTNIQDHLQLWHYRNLVVHGKLGLSRSFSGYDYDIEILFFRGLPEGTTIFADPQKIGELLIKESIQDIASISEIRNDEREKILKDLPSIKPETLDENVRILVYEVIKVNIIESDAAVILQRKE